MHSGDRDRRNNSLLVLGGWTGLQMSIIQTHTHWLLSLSAEGAESQSLSSGSITNDGS